MEQRHYRETLDRRIDRIEERGFLTRMPRSHQHQGAAK